MAATAFRVLAIFVLRYISSFRTGFGAAYITPTRHAGDSFPISRFARRSYYAHVAGKRVWECFLENDANKYPGSEFAL